MLYKINKLSLVILTLLLLVYFVYHSIHGKRGLISMFNIEQDLTEKRATLLKLEQERQKLEKMVSLLQPNNFDSDLVDELSRDYLGLIGQNEKVLIIQNYKFLKNDKNISNK